MNLSDLFIYFNNVGSFCSFESVGQNRSKVCGPRQSLGKLAEIVKQCTLYMYMYIYADVVEWSRALDIRLSDWCCSVSMV